MKICLYDETQKETWNRFVLLSKNATFLFNRDYMDYHRDRFLDFSLIIYDQNENAIALFPANRDNDVIISHQGLTYGGFVCGESMTQPLMLKVFGIMIDFLRENDFSKLIYKTIPSIYHLGPSDEDKYTLFLLNALLMRRDSLTVIDNLFPIKFQDRRIRSIKKAKKLSLTVKQTNDFVRYWEILSDNLREKHAAVPVHTVNEMVMLSNRFPDNIKLFGCYQEEKFLGGVIVYESERVAHFQYIATNQDGMSLGALDFLFSTLIYDIYASKRYIDFGISNENDGRYMNKGLVEFKEGFGGRTITHDFYHLELTPNMSQHLIQAIS